MWLTAYRQPDWAVALPACAITSLHDCKSATYNKEEKQIKPHIWKGKETS